MNRLTSKPLIVAFATDDVLFTDGPTGVRAFDASKLVVTSMIGSLAALSSINNSNWSGTALAIGNGGTGATTASGARVSLLPSYAGNGGKILALNAGATDTEWIAAGGGTVTSVSVVTANGISGTVANASTTPAITLSLGAIDPTSIGATTPGTGKFTTLAANSNILSSGGVVGYSSGTTVYTIGSGGYNGPVGGSTPAAGSFTTLSATNDVTFSKVAGSTILDIGTVANTNNATIQRYYPGSGVRSWLVGAQYNVSGFEITPSTANGGSTFSTPVAVFTPSGLAVTGGLSTTGLVDITAVATPALRIGSGTTRIEMGYSAGLTGNYIESLNPTGGSVDMLYYIGGSNTHKFYTGGALRTSIDSTGLAVTGALAATGQITSGIADANCFLTTSTGYGATTRGYAVSNSAGNDATYFGMAGSSASGVIPANEAVIYSQTALNVQIGASVITRTSSTGLAVTGDISGTGVYSTTTGSAANVFVDSTGLLQRSTSSLRYKTDVRDYTRGLDALMSLRPVFYKGKSEADGDKQFAGLIAEEVHDAGLTEFVQYDKDGNPDALAYQNMVALLISSSKELVAELKALRARVAQLENKA